jgi:hypothetical protein
VFRDDSFYIVEATPGVAGEHDMGVARAAQDKFVLGAAPYFHDS